MSNKKIDTKKIQTLGFRGSNGPSFFADGGSEERYAVEQYCAIFWDGNNDHSPIIANQETDEMFQIVMYKKRARAFVGCENMAIATDELDVSERFSLKQGGIFIAMWLCNDVTSANLIVIESRKDGYVHFSVECMVGGDEKDKKYYQILQNMFRGCVSMIPTWNNNCSLPIWDELKQLQNKNEIGGCKTNDEE